MSSARRYTHTQVSLYQHTTIYNSFCQEETSLTFGAHTVIILQTHIVDMFSLKTALFALFTLQNLTGKVMAAKIKYVYRKSSTESVHPAIEAKTSLETAFVESTPVGRGLLESLPLATAQNSTNAITT